jgi:hypothetical protein
LPRPSHRTQFDQPKNIWRRVQIMQCSHFPHP